MDDGGTFVNSSMVRGGVDRGGGGGRPASLLLIDEAETFLLPLAAELNNLGIEVSTARTFDAATAALAFRRPSYVVSEPRVDGRWLFDYIDEVAERVPVQAFGVVTAYPSVATAVRFTRMGVAAYLAKPVLARDLMHALRVPRFGTGSDAMPTTVPLDWPSLDRTIWEYLSRTCATAGSISEAARRLGLDRRSLRRMLAKHPPSR